MNNKLTECCKDVKTFIEKKDYQKCEHEIIKLMEAYPHSAVPHNLYGILLEAQQDHLLAMKHFRAANALDPTYIPARYNMEQYGEWNPRGIHAAYSMEDCVDICKKQKDSQFYIKYDKNKVGHIIHK